MECSTLARMSRHRPRGEVAAVYTCSVMRRSELVKIRQRLDRTRLQDPRGALHAQLTALDDVVRRGDRIAIAAGSRGRAR